MKRFIGKYGRGLALAVLVAAAGCSYSCGGKEQGELLSGVQAWQPGENTENKESWLTGDFAQAEEYGAAAPVKEGLVETDALLGPDPLQEPEDLPAASCFVHVCGEVRNPGVYELLEGQRVYEAIALAGGFSDKAAKDYLNLADLVRDGMKLQVPSQEQVSDTAWAELGQPGGAVGTGGQSTELLSSKKVNLNTASKEELMTLRGIGEARAEDIIRYRQERGGFGRIEEIMEVSGIKDAAFQKIKEDITV